MPHEMPLATPQAQDLGRAAELNSVGAKLFSAGHLEAARLHFLAALSVDPNNHLVLQNLGAVMRSMGHHAVAESLARRSVRASNRNPFCLSNLGVAQLSLRQYHRALATLRTVTRLLPESGPSWHNYGLALYMQGLYALALEAFDKAKALQGHNPQVESDRGLTLLALGNIQAGLAAYEVRWEILAKSKIWALDIPEWQGELLDGRRILVHHEQGFGDSIMLARFLAPLALLGAHITVAAPKELLRLFESSFGHFASIATLDDETLGTPGRFDYHSPMLSVMRWLRVEMPSAINPAPYMKAPDLDNIAARLPVAAHRIGICWASGNHGPVLMERRRMVPLVEFLPLTELADTAVISLQKGEDVRDIEANGLEGIIFDMAPRLVDFAATAAVIAQLDVVISVDSAVAHLAGALGKRCIMLSPYSRCWRWWGAAVNAHVRNGLPWYDNMPVLYQSANGSWQNAVHEAVQMAAYMAGVG